MCVHLLDVGQLLLMQWVYQNDLPGSLKLLRSYNL